LFCAAARAGIGRDQGGNRPGFRAGPRTALQVVISAIKKIKGVNWPLFLDIAWKHQLYYQLNAIVAEFLPDKSHFLATH
jgi:hypothetical protein